MAVDKQPQLLHMIDNHEIKSIVQQVVSGADISLNEHQIQAINEWMDNLAEHAAHERKRWDLNSQPLQAKRTSLESFTDKVIQ